MVRFGMRAAAFSALLLAGACAGFDLAPDPAPSPRAECASETVTIYFQEESATMQPLSDPLIVRLMERANACTAAGGELRELRIAAFPDRGARGGDADLETRERAAQVRAALLAAGAPPDKIRVVRPRAERGAIMQRRAEVTAILW